MTRDLNLLQLIPRSLDQQVQILHHLMLLKNSSQEQSLGCLQTCSNERPSQTIIDGARYGKCKNATWYFSPSFKCKKKWTCEGRYTRR